MSFSTLKTPIKTIYSNNSNQLLRCRYLQRVFQSIIKFHDCSLVTTTITIVWSTENRYYIPVMAPVISLQGKKKGHKNTFYSLIYITKCDSTQKKKLFSQKGLKNSNTVSQTTIIFCALHNFLNQNQYIFLNIWPSVNSSICLISLSYCSGSKHDPRMSIWPFLVKADKYSSETTTLLTLLSVVSEGPKLVIAQVKRIDASSISGFIPSVYSNA